MSWCRKWWPACRARVNQWISVSLCHVPFCSFFFPLLCTDWLLRWLPRLQSFPNWNKIGFWRGWWLGRLNDWLLSEHRQTKDSGWGDPLLWPHLVYHWTHNVQITCKNAKHSHQLLGAYDLPGPGLVACDRLILWQLHEVCSVMIPTLYKKN